MDLSTPASEQELQDLANRLRNVTIAFSVLIVILFLIVAALIAIVYFIIYKLKQHERAIYRLETEDYMKVHYKRSIASSGSDAYIEHGKSEISDYEKVIRRRKNSRRITDGDDSETLRSGGKTPLRVTVVIAKETVNVYGKSPRIGQIMNLAQTYYKKKTNTDTDIPAESVEILDDNKRGRNAQSKIFTEDWSDGTVPTSLLPIGTAQRFQDIVTQNKGIFIHKTVGPDGGTMSISGIKLTVPKGALDSPVLLTIGVLWDENFFPTLTKKETMLSPIVLCQPSGIQFNAPLTISFPHSAVNIIEDWNVKILKRNGNLTEDTEWSQTNSTETFEIQKDDASLTLRLVHFTLYTCIGESKSGKTAAKAVQVVAFAGSPKRGDFFKPIFYFLNNYKEEIEDVKMEIDHIDPNSRLHETSVLLVHDNEQDVMVELEHLSDGWKLCGEKVESIQFELIWHALQPHCSFILKPEQRPQEIHCIINAYQNGRENFAAKLKIADTVKQSIPDNDEDPLSELIDELIVLLDPENKAGSDAGNWKDLADKMGCGLARIRWLKAQESPTKILVRKWIHEKKKSLADLKSLLLEINRPDAAYEVDKRLRASGQSVTVL